MSTHYIFKPLFILKLVPKIIRDNMYKFVAKRRRKILKSCNLGIGKPKIFFKAKLNSPFVMVLLRNKQVLTKH